jgi:REP element-mobilizing transposase RayT
VLQPSIFFASRPDVSAQKKNETEDRLRELNREADHVHLLIPLRRQLGSLHLLPTL